MESRRTAGTSDQMDHGMDTRMRLRGHFIGALSLAIISIACTPVNAKSTDGAADEHAHHPAPLPSTNPNTPGYPIADQLLTELFNATAAGGATVNAMMEDPT
jgi:hypothetical protein